MSEDLTLDSLFNGAIKLLQPRRGYRFSVDAPILASFVRLKRGERVVDLGTGCGVILLILAHRFPQAGGMVGVEIQQGLAELASRNVELNGLGGLIRVLHGDIKECRRLFGAGSFDVAVSNPPYYPLGRGRVNAEDGRAIARHELMATIEDVVEASRYLVKGGGRVYYIYPARRAVTLLAEMRRRSIEPKRMRWVHPSPAKGAEMVLVEGMIGAKEGLEVEPPLVVHGAEGGYTEEMERVLFKLEVEDEM